MSISFDNLFIVYLSVFLAVIFGAWIMLLWKRGSVSEEEKSEVECIFCGHPFQCETHRTHVRCPSCYGRFNVSQIPAKRN